MIDLPVGFAFGLVVFCLAAVAFGWFGSRLVWPAVKAAAVAAGPGWRRVSHDRRVRRYGRLAGRRYPRASRWLSRRLDSGHPAGLLLTGGIVTALLLIAGFVSLAKDVLLRDEIVDLDQVLIQIVYGLRTDVQTDFFRFVTYMGGIEAMAVLLLLITALAWKHRLLPLAFGAALAAAVTITQSLKLVFGRLRPDEALRLVIETGFSFPSGHSFVATIMYGLAGYVLFRTARSQLAQLAAIAGAVTMIILVGSSRVYLGVHFPSDVLASVLFGSALLCLLVTVIEINQRFRLRPRLYLTAASRQPLLLSLAGAALTAFVLSSL